jgi:hypothetical protein
MSDKDLPIEQILSILTEMPQRIAQATAGLTDAQLQSAPVKGEWTINEVLAHLRACSDVWGGNIRRMLEEDTPTFAGVSPRTYIKQTDYPAQAFAPSFRAFTSQRADLLAVLRALPPEGWERYAMVTAYGQVHRRSVQHQADNWARHEREHTRQIERIAEAVK